MDNDDTRDKKDISCYYRLICNLGCFIAYNREFLKHHLEGGETEGAKRLNDFYKPAVVYSLKDSFEYFYIGVEDKDLPGFTKQFTSWFHKGKRRKSMRALIKTADENEWPSNKNSDKKDKKVDEPNGNDKFILVRLLRELRDGVFSVEDQTPLIEYVNCIEEDPYWTAKRYEEEEIKPFQNEPEFQKKIDHLRSKMDKPEACELKSGNELESIASMEKGLIELEIEIESNTRCSNSAFLEFIEMLKSIVDSFVSCPRKYSKFKPRIQNVFKELDVKKENKFLIPNLMNLYHHNSDSSLGKRSLDNAKRYYDE